jgi:hypothetical protein
MRTVVRFSLRRIPGREQKVSLTKATKRPPMRRISSLTDEAKFSRPQRREFNDRNVGQCLPNPQPPSSVNCEVL